jgi:ankyrin repeat protein
VSLLLDHEADVNMATTFGCIPLCATITNPNLAAMQLLLEHGAAADSRCLAEPLTHYASSGGFVDALRLLLQHNADVNATDQSNSTALHCPSTIGHVDVAQILLDHGADINAVSKNGTPLYNASEQGHLEVVRLLLKREADMNIHGPEHQTPFQAATMRGHAQIVQLLLENGANNE